MLSEPQVTNADDPIELRMVLDGLGYARLVVAKAHVQPEASAGAPMEALKRVIGALDVTFVPAALKGELSAVMVA